MGRVCGGCQMEGGRSGGSHLVGRRGPGGDSVGVWIIEEEGESVATGPFGKKKRLRISVKRVRAYLGGVLKRLPE